MKKIMPVLFLCLLTFLGKAQTGASALIPAPVSVQEEKGVFMLSSKITMITPVAFIEPSGFLSEQLMGSKDKPATKHSAVTSKRTAKVEKNTIIFAAAKVQDSMGEEGYRLSIEPLNITITARTASGALKGVFTLLQLQLLQTDMQKIPCAVITDKPRFAYRGLQLDVSRNFFPISFIKKYIDLMALYKYNTFHWHLTDNGGWRLQVKKYPLLTGVAAFRTRSSW